MPTLTADVVTLCSFRAGDIESAACPNRTDGRTRELGGIDLPACDRHERDGGFLHRAAMDDYRARFAARFARENAEAAARLGVEATEHRGFPSACQGCGRRLFTGNDSGLCSECWEPT